MPRKFLAIVLVVLLLVPVAYIAYGYSQFSSAVNPPRKAPASTYVIVGLPDGRYLVFTPQEYVNATLHGWEPPAGSKSYLANLTGYITGIPEVDLNLTLRAHYERFTIVVGGASVKVCSSNPDEFVGSCPDRTAAVSEISALVATLFKRYYYWEGIKQGMDNASAKKYAYEETIKRHGVAHLSFWTKAMIGMGRTGNKKHLAVILVGPAEGAIKNRVIVARPGLVVIEGRSDGALRAEIAMVEKVIGFKWPEEPKE